MITKIEGYLLIPHELLHVLGYRLVGKRCVYRWGDHRVKALGSLSRDEQLFGLLFPLVVCVVLAIILLPLPAVGWFLGRETWLIVFTIFPAIPLAYASASIGDLRRAYLLITGKKSQDKTPFDFFFWPIIAEDKKSLQKTALIILGFLVATIIVSIYLMWPIKVSP